MVYRRRGTGGKGEGGSREGRGSFVMGPIYVGSEGREAVVWG